jgi:solute:Na+ symporter, SSS family
VSLAPHPVDLTVIAIYLVATIAIGVLLAGRVKAYRDFFLAGRSLTTPILICTLVSSYYGLDALLGDSGDASREGVVVWFTYGRPYTLALLVAALLLARRLRGMEALSLADLLGQRYGRSTQLAAAVASFLYALPVLAIMGLAAMGEVMFGIPLWLGACLGSAVSVVYVALGGAWADVLTDTVQFGVMSVSLAVALPYILAAVGGFDGIRATLGGAAFEPLGSAPPLYTIAYALTAVSVLVEPLFYQRMLAAHDTAAVRKAFLWGILIWAAYDWATTAVGMAGGAMMASGTLPSNTPRDQVLIRLVPLYLPVGVSGLFLGGCLAAAMSTVDSYFLIAAGNLVYDIYRPLVRRDLDDRTLIRYTRGAMLLSAVMCVVLGLYFERIKEAWAFAATVLTSTLLVPTLMGLFLSRRAVPLAGALAAWGGLGAVVVFYVVIHVWGAPDLDLETRRMDLAGVTWLREYALFVAVPVSALGYVLGRILGCRR